MAGKNFAKLLKDAKDLGRFEGFMAYMECAVVQYAEKKRLEVARGENRTG